MLKWILLVVALVWATDFAYGGEIIEGPTDVAVASEGIAMFKCVVRKNEGDEVQWLLDENVLLFEERTIRDNVVFDEFRFSVTGTGNEYLLRISQITETDARKYTCKVQPPRGSGAQPVQQSASLVVHRAPDSSVPACLPKQFGGRVRKFTDNYRIGNEISFQCESERGYPAVNLRWTNENDDTVNATLDESTLNEVALYFNRILTPSDNGKTFTCTSTYTSTFVTNQTGSCQIGPLNVQYPPMSIELKGKSNIDQDGNADFGKDIIVRCNGTGANPEILTYSWKITPSLPDDHVDRYQEIDHILRIISVQEDDQGRVIQCTARNDVGAIVSNNITINVTNIPTTTIPTTIITTEPPTTIKVIPPPSMPFSTTYIIIVILVALVILLATVCLVLFLVNRQKQPDVRLYHMPTSVASTISRNQNFGRQLSTNTWLDAEDDACSLKGKSSRPGTPCMEKRVIANEDIKLGTLNSNQYNTHGNIYGDGLGEVRPEDSASNVMLSPDIDDDLKKRRTPRDSSPESSTCSHCSHHSSRPYKSKTPNPEKSHKKLKPTNSTGPEWPNSEKNMKYSPLARRHYQDGPPDQNMYESPPQQHYNTVDTRTRRATEGDLMDYDSSYDNQENFKKGHRRNRSQGSASLGGIVESPVDSLNTSPVFSPQHHGYASSPVMQRKYKRQHSSSSLSQLNVLQQQQGPHSHHNSPRASPRPSPHHSPAHHPHAHANRPLPDPGLDQGNLLIAFDGNGPYPAQEYYSNQPHQGYSHQPPQGYSNQPPQGYQYGRHSMPRMMAVPQISYNGDAIDEHFDDDDDDSSEIDEISFCDVHGPDAACDCDQIRY